MREWECGEKSTGLTLVHVVSYSLTVCYDVNYYKTKTYKSVLVFVVWMCGGVATQNMTPHQILKWLAALANRLESHTPSSLLPDCEMLREKRYDLRMFAAPVSF